MAKKAGVITLLAVLMGCLWVITSWAMEPGDQRWAHQGDTTGYPGPIVKIDNQGNRFVASTVEVSGSAEWQVISYDKNGVERWKKSFSPGGSSGNYLMDMALDKDGNVIVVGSAVLTETSNKDWLITSLDKSDGHTLWWNYYDYDKEDSEDEATLVTVDRNGNIVVAGYETVNGEKLSVVQYYSYPTYNVKWTTTLYLSPLNSISNSPTSITVDSTGRIIVGGYTLGSDRNWFVCVISPTGGEILGENFYAGDDAGPDYDSLTKVVTDDSNNIIAAGIFTINGGTNLEILSLSFSTSSGITKNWAITLPNGDSLQDLTIDTSGHIVAAGSNSLNGGDFYVVSISSSGSKRWESTYDSGYGLDRAYALGISPDGGVVATGVRRNQSSNFDWYTACLDPTTGERRWSVLYDGGKGDFPNSIAVDQSSKDVVVVGSSGDDLLIIDYEGGCPLTPSAKHVLKPAEVRTINPAASTPDPDNGKYLGFGDVVSGGHKFKIEAEFPAYLKESDNSVMNVKIFIAAQMPDDYSRLAYFDSSNNMKYQPPDKLSSWKASVNGAIAKTTVFQEVDTSSLVSVPKGTHYWYTLVVPDTVPDDFSGVDWATTPWEITVNIFEVK